MKHYDLKRALLIFSIFCVVFFIVLFWQQTSPSNDFTELFPINKRSPLIKHEEASDEDITTQSRKLKHSRTLITSREVRIGTAAVSDVKVRTFFEDRKIYSPQWTWICENQRCERRQADSNSPPKSLLTCSMLCGSTQLWPQPTGQVTLGSKTASFNHAQLHFETKAKEPALRLLLEAISIFQEKIVNLVQNANYTKHETDLEKIVIVLSITNSDHVKLILNTDESYQLNIKPMKKKISIHIKAYNFFGVRHGLETLSQLIWWDEYSNGGTLKILKTASVKDDPVFAYRGLMIDTARNYMSIDTLKRVLVGMSANKLNILHWHITDSQSFPLVLPRLPKFAKMGSYAPDMIYTPKDVEELVLFALVRGIRVMIEIDTPAHAGNGWTWGPSEDMGELALCVNKRPWSSYCGEPPCGQLNPDNPKVYDVLEILYSDLLNLTKETELFHIGGDEVFLECWQDHLSTATLNKYSDLHDLWGDFTLKALDRLKKANGGKNIPYILIWSSNLTKRPYVNKYLNKSNIVVQSWGASQWPETLDLIQDGYKVIISHVDAWYVDCGFGRWRETGDAACDPYRTWQTVYNHRPWTQQGMNKKQILGGEICLWSEQVDESAVDTRLWPRAAAFAERVWSDPTTDFTIEEDVYTRLNTQRGRLVKQGLHAEAMWPLWCLQNPGMCL